MNNLHLTYFRPWNTSPMFMHRIHVNILDKTATDTVIDLDRIHSHYTKQNVVSNSQYSVNPAHESLKFEGHTLFLNMNKRSRQVEIVTSTNPSTGYGVLTSLDPKYRKKGACLKLAKSEFKPAELSD